MKKILKILAVSLFVILVVSAAGVFIFIKTFKVSRFKPQIIAASESAIGRSVDFGDIALNVSLERGIQIRLNDLKVAEHPDFGAGSFLTVKEIKLGISLKDLIFKRQLRVLNVQAQAPEITIIRLKDGRINAQAFAFMQQGGGKSKTGFQETSQKEAVPAAAVSAIFINRVNVREGRVKYLDYLAETAVSLELKNISLNTEDISLTRPFALDLSAAFLSEVPNIAFRGKAEINTSRFSFLFKDALVSIDLSSLSLEALREAVPQLQGFTGFEINSSELTFSIRLLEVSQQGILVLDGTFEIKEGNISGVNILRMVLDKLAIAPNLAEILEANLPPRFKEKINAKDTVLTAFLLDIGVSNGAIIIDLLDILADGFIFKGNGKVNFDQSYELDGVFTIPQDLALSMIEAVPQMDILLDQARGISFPLKVSGKGGAISFRPDVKSIAVTVIKSKIQEEVGKALRKVFDKNEEGDIQASPQGHSDEASQESASPDAKEENKKVIKDIINTIFK